jgi:cell division protein FtsZ
MSLNINVALPNPELSPKITVIGVGGAGGNAVNNMIQSKLGGVEFLVTNTDSQALQQSLCERRIQLGRSITQGLGAGSRPDIGRAAAEEALDEILTDLEGAHMAFVTAGMGGGTGTGAAPVIARAAREAGILTVGVVTKPFHFEGVHRMRLAETGINDLAQYVDTLIIIPNQNLFRVANEKTTFADAFKMADDVLDCGVRGVTDLMVNPGLINLDFADIRSVMSEMGKAMMGTGEADGENRAVEAAEAAINNPLLDDVSMKGARGVLINITGGLDLTLFEVDEAANRIRDEVDPDANIIFGSTFSQEMEGVMRVSVVATGIDAEEISAPRPVSLSVVAGLESPAPEVEETPADEWEAMAEIISDRAATSSSGANPEAMGAEDLAATGQDHSQDQESVHDQAMPQSEVRAEASYEQVTTETPSAQAAEVQRAAPAARREESFFAPPPPMEPESQSLSFDQANAQPEPFAEADLANASRAGSAPKSVFNRKATQSLFARVTGAAKALQAATTAMDSSGTAEPRLSPSRQQEPSLARQPRPAPAAAPAPRPEPTPTAASSHSQSSALDAAERVKTTEAEEELLDIPAFLRRQAN